MSATPRKFAALVAAILFALPAQAGVVIDNFDMPTIPVVVTSFTGPSLGTPTPGPFTSRTVSVSGVGGISTVGSGLLTGLKATAAGTDSVTVGFTGPGASFAPNQYLVLNFLSASGPLLGNISLSAAFNGAAAAVVDASLPTITSPDKITIPLLAIPIVGTLASVTSLTLRFDLLGAATNFSLTSLTTAVPETSSYVAWIILASCMVMGVRTVQSYQRRTRSRLA